MNYDEVNQIVKYRFFASSLDRVLNIDGYVEIENSLYKFTEDNQYISYDGNKSRIEDALSNCNLKSQDIDKDPYLFVLNNNNLKSSNTTIEEEGVKTVDKYRMIYSLEKVVFSRFSHIDKGYGVPIYHYGYRLYLTMSQYYNGLFGWRSDRGYYYLRDIYLYLNEYGYGNGGNGYNGSMPDKNYTAKKRREVTHDFFRMGFLGITQGNVDFVYNLDVSFWSDGIKENNKVTLNID